MASTHESESMRQYLAELDDVPKALERLCNFATGDGKPAFLKIADLIRGCSALYLFGMASSQWLSWPLALALENHGTVIRWRSAYEGLQMAHSGIARNAVAILVSQSGKTIETCTLAAQLKQCPSAPKVIAVTNGDVNPLAEHADIVLDVKAGKEEFAPSKSYVNSSAALMLLYAHLIDPQDAGVESAVDLLSETVESSASFVSKSREWAEKACDAWSTRQGPIQFLATGSQLGSAWQASMLCTELAHIFAGVNEWRTFLHGFDRQVDDSFMVIGFRPVGTLTGRWETTIDCIEYHHGHVSSVPCVSDMCGHTAPSAMNGLLNVLAPTWETIPIHHLCIQLARKHNLDPSKIGWKYTEDWTGFVRRSDRRPL